MYFYISAPINSLIINVANVTTPLLPSETELFHHATPPSEGSAPRVLFIEGSPRTIHCIAEGGYPVPSVSVFLGDRDITSEFQLSQSVTLTGQRGLRSILYRTERSCDSLVFTAYDDEQPIRCVATVPGMAANRSEIYVIVICK